MKLISSLMTINKFNLICQILLIIFCLFINIAMADTTMIKNDEELISFYARYHFIVWNFSTIANSDSDSIITNFIDDVSNKIAQENVNIICPITIYPDSY